MVQQCSRPGMFLLQDNSSRVLCRTAGAPSLAGCGHLTPAGCSCRAVHTEVQLTPTGGQLQQGWSSQGGAAAAPSPSRARATRRFPSCAATAPSAARWGCPWRQQGPAAASYRRRRSRTHAALPPLRRWTAAAGMQSTSLRRLTASRCARVRRAGGEATALSMPAPRMIRRAALLRLRRPYPGACYAPPCPTAALTADAAYSTRRSQLLHCRCRGGTTWCHTG